MAMDYWIKKRILDQHENPALMGSEGGKAAARNNARRKALKEHAERQEARFRASWYGKD